MQKTFFLFVALGLSISLWAQMPVTSRPFNCPLGSTSEQMLASWSEHDNEIRAISSSAWSVSGDIEGAGYTWGSLLVGFYDNHLFAAVAIDEASRAGADKYSEMSQSLTSRYGESQTTCRRYVEYLEHELDTRFTDYYAHSDSLRVVVLATNQLHEVMLMYMDIASYPLSQLHGLLSGAPAKAQDVAPQTHTVAVNAVAGLRMFAPMQEALQLLKQRYGESSVEQLDPYTLQCSNVVFSGCQFRTATFYFRYNPESGEREFVSVSYETSFARRDLAQDMYIQLMQPFDHKYADGVETVNSYSDRYKMYGAPAEDAPLNQQGRPTQPVCLHLSAVPGSAVTLVSVTYFQYRRENMYEDEI